MTERRFSRDGIAYSYREFIDFFGEEKGPPPLPRFFGEEAGNAASENASSNETADINSSSEHAPMPKTPLPFAAQLSDDDQQLTAAVSDVATPAVGSALQCPACKAQICQPQDLCFFSRGHEVHLILKPELPTMPPAFILAPIPEEGATQSWQCACGNQLGDTRPVGPNKVSMTAFKSASVMLYGQHHPGKKSKWPTLYCVHPFNSIEVRNRDSFHGP